MCQVFPEKNSFVSFLNKGKRGQGILSISGRRHDSEVDKDSPATWTASRSTKSTSCISNFLFGASGSQWNASQDAHGNVSIDKTICIGDIKWRPLLSNKPAVQLERVRLFQVLPLYKRRLVIFIFIFFPQKLNGDLTLQFWSSAAISRSIFPSSNFSPLDYFDDLGVILCLRIYMHRKSADLK